MALLAFLALACPAYSHAQAATPPEDARAIRTREFLGLGRLPDPKRAAEGAKLFAPTCSFCHGADARGASGPDLLRSAVVLDDDRGEGISATVRNGRAAQGMPAFPALTGDQLRDIAEYLHQQVELAANRGTYKTLNILTGNAGAGEAYFHGGGQCTTCHSVTGDLAHIGGKKSPSDLQQLWLYPGKPQLSPRATVTFAGGKTMTGILKHLDDFSVSLIDDAGMYHAMTRQAGVEVQVEDKLLFHRQMLEKYTNQQMHDLTAFLVTLQ